VQERPWSNNFVLSKILPSVRRVIAVCSSSGLSKFPTLAIGNASDQVAEWLFSAASSRQWFKGLLVFSRVLSEMVKFWVKRRK